MKKKLITILFTLIFFVSFQTNAFAQEIPHGLEYRIEIHGNVKGIKITKYTGTASELVIPETIQSLPVVAIKGRAFTSCERLTAITLPDTLISIEEWAFYDCKNLAKINIPHSVILIGSSAFMGCESLSDIFIPYDVTYLGGRIFVGCTNLKEINVDANNRAYCSEGGVLYNKNKTILIKCPQKKEGAFVIPNSVTRIEEEAFMECAGLTGVTIPDGITVLPYRTFWGCESLTSIIIPDSVTRINSEVFLDCFCLAEITIPNSVTVIEEWAFANCISLANVIIGENVASIEERAFYECRNLVSVTFLRGNIKISEVQAFPGDLHKKYLVGGAGTYVRERHGNAWTKRP